MTDMAFIDPPTTTVVVRGQEIVVSPLVVGELPAFALALAPLSAGVGSLMQAFARARADGAELDDVAVAREVLELVGLHGEAALRALGIAVRKEPTFIAVLRLDEAVALGVTAIRINADFFGRALPGMAAGADQLRGVLTTSGATPSTS